MRGESSSEDSLFLQARMRTMFWIMGWLTWAALPLHVATITLAPETRTRYPAFTLATFAWLAAAAGLACWMVRRGQARTVRELRAIEV